MQYLDIKMQFNYIMVMRTTIRINDSLLQQLRKLALENNTTLNDLIEQAVREKLARIGRQKTNKQVKIITFKGNGLQPGVDLDDSSALLDLMEK